MNVNLGVAVSWGHVAVECQIKGLRMNKELLELQAFLALLPAGDLNEENQGTVEGLLAGCWDSLLLRDRGGMRPEKISFRLEKVNWDPPYLTFDIERHGGTVLGSPYAEIQSWKINVQDATGTVVHNASRRLVGKLAPPLAVEPLVQRVLDLIIAGKPDPCLKWKSPSAVKVLVGGLIPSLGVAKQTLAGRRRRFAIALERALSTAGWTKVSVHTYERLLS